MRKGRDISRVREDYESSRVCVHKNEIRMTKNEDNEDKWEGARMREGEGREYGRLRINQWSYEWKCVHAEKTTVGLYNREKGRYKETRPPPIQIRTQIVSKCTLQTSRSKWRILDRGRENGRRVWKRFDYQYSQSIMHSQSILKYRSTGNGIDCQQYEYRDWSGVEEGNGGAKGRSQLT